MGVDRAALTETLERFNLIAAAGVDEDFQRGHSAYDHYYGDPTQTPNPNLRPLSGTLYAVKMVVSDLGTCGGLMTNVFGHSYPGAGATISQGLVYGYMIAKHAAEAR